MKENLNTINLTEKENINFKINSMKVPGYNNPWKDLLLSNIIILLLSKATIKIT
jgi:hypothetical protein